MAETVLTSMCMVIDNENGNVLVQERKKNWKGINFPGGHVEAGEGIAAAAIREVKEETGLTVAKLRPCGIIHWYNDSTGDRYLVFNFKTCSFSGELINETDEGRVFWAPIKDLTAMDLAEGFRERLPMFFEDACCEGFAVWNEDNKSAPMKWL